MDGTPIQTLINFNDSCLYDERERKQMQRGKSGKRPKSAKKKQVD